MKEGDTALFFLHGLKNERVTWLSTGFGVLHYYTAATLTPELRRQAGRQAQSLGVVRWKEFQAPRIKTLRWTSEQPVRE